MEQEEKFSVAGVRGPGGKRGGEFQGIIRGQVTGGLGDGSNKFGLYSLERGETWLGFQPGRFVTSLLWL